MVRRVSLKSYLRHLCEQVGGTKGLLETVGFKKMTEYECWWRVATLKLQETKTVWTHGTNSQCNRITSAASLTSSKPVPAKLHDSLTKPQTWMLTLWWNTRRQLNKQITTDMVHRPWLVSAARTASRLLTRLRSWQTWRRKLMALPVNSICDRQTPIILTTALYDN